MSTTRTDLKIAGSAARLAGHPGVVARLNSGWDPSEPVSRSGWRWRRHRWYHRRFVQLAATNSRAGKSDLVARDYLPPERIVPIHNGVDLVRFDPERVARGAFRAELGIPANAELIVSVSRYAERKGQEYELEAAGRLTEARPELHMAFLGPCRQREQPFKQGLIARASLFPGRERVHFMGDRAGRRDRDLRDAGGGAGRGDRAIVAAVGELLDLPPERRIAMGKGGRAHVLEHFTLDRMAEEYESLFERALAERPPFFRAAAVCFG